jgi:hypothetical protein
MSASDFPTRTIIPIADAVKVKPGGPVNPHSSFGGGQLLSLADA